MPDEPSLLIYPGGGALLVPELAQSLTEKNARTVQGMFDELSYYERSKVGQGGRQAAWFIRGPAGLAVLRHYRRGGLVAHISDRHYIWTGMQRTRPWREFQVMAYLHRQAVAVPRVLGATWWRYSLYYTGSLMTERLVNTTPLAKQLTDAYLQPVAQQISLMHQAGVWHADLNAYNILLDQTARAWLIDFDRAKRMAMTSKLRRDNLLRLRRSLVKLHGQAGEQWWQKLDLVYSSLIPS